MFLEIITPEKKIFEGKVISIAFPGKTGGFEILNDHAPIISTLKKGEIKVTNSQKKVENFSINGGVVEVQRNKIIVLAD